MKISFLTENFGVIIKQLNKIYLTSDEINTISTLLKKRGLILFTQSKLNIEESELFCKQFGETTGYKDVFTDIPELGFHSEFAFMPFSPDIIWFYCQEPAELGGETKICDGVQVLAEMKEETRLLFYRKPIRYHMQFSAKDWRELFRVADLNALVDLFNKVNSEYFSYQIGQDETLDFQYTTFAIRPTKFLGVDAFINTIIHAKNRSRYGLRFADGDPIPAEVIEELRSLTEKLTFLIKWKKNDFAMIDNTRMLHGRVGYFGNKRIIKALHTSSLI